MGTGVLQLAHYPNLYYVKDNLGAEPPQYTFFKSMGTIAWTIKPIMAYCEDMLAPFGYRVKSWVTIGSFMVISTSLTVYFTTPGLTQFTAQYALMNFFAVVMDIIAQSLAVTTLALHRKIGETRARIEGKSDEEIKADGEAEVLEGKKLYGNYVIYRFFSRAASIFIGGVIGSSLSIQIIFLMIGLVQLPILIYTLCIFSEERKGYVLSPDFHLVNNMLSFSKSIFCKQIALPLILGLVILLSPDVKDAGTYILTDILHWSSIKLSFAGIIGSVLYYIIMHYTVNKAKSLGLMLQLFIAASASTFNSLMMFRFIFLEAMNFPLMFFLTVMAAFSNYLTSDMVLIPIVARYSSACPKGIEGFGVTSIAAIVNTADTLSGLWGAKLLSLNHVVKASYDDLYIPVTISCSHALFGMFLTPIIGK